MYYPLIMSPGIPRDIMFLHKYFIEVHNVLSRFNNMDCIFIICVVYVKIYALLPDICTYMLGRYLPSHVAVDSLQPN